MNKKDSKRTASDPGHPDVPKKRLGRPPKVALEILVDLYQFKTIRGVAREAGMTASAVQKRLKAHDVQRDPVGRPRIDEDLTEFDQLLLSDSPRSQPVPKSQIAEWKTRGVKRCKFCQEEKPLTEFWKGSGALGRVTACKSCAGRQATLKYRRRYRTDDAFRQYKRDRASANRAKNWVRSAWSESNACASARSVELNLPYSQWCFLLDECEYRCVCCGRTADQIRQQDRRSVPLTPEHAKPICLGGTHDIRNIQPLCLLCNSKKGRDEVDYLEDMRADLVKRAWELH